MSCKWIYSSEESEEEHDVVPQVSKVEEVRSPSFVVFFLRTQLEAATAKRNRE